MSGPKGESGIKGNKNEKRGKPLAFIRDLIDRYYAHDVARDGAALTYYLLFAIFPLLVFVSTLVGLMDLDIEETLTAMSRILPEQVLNTSIERILEHLNRRGNHRRVECCVQ